jgi:ATP-binding cassette, subfamily F, member 3
VYGNVSLLQETSQKFEAVQKELKKVNEQWEEQMLVVEELESKIA